MQPSSPDKNIISTFLKAAADNPDGIALMQDGAEISYRDLKDEVVATAGLYRLRGIAKGDMALVFVPMSMPLYRVVLALFYIGACPVFLDEWVSIGRLKECLKVVQCKAIIAKPAYLFLSLFIGPVRRIPIRIAAGKTARLQPPPLLPAGVAGEDTALVTFTTGSTGTPKAANRTHAYLFAQLAALNPLLSNVASPCLTLLPIVVLLHLAAGKTAILPPKRFKAAKKATIAHLEYAIRDARPQALIASPAVVSLLIPPSAGPSVETAAAFRNVKSVVTGGGPVYPDLAKRLLAAFPAAAIITVYGSTEAEPITHISADDLSRATPETLLLKGLPVGLPDEAAEVAILNLNATPGAITDSISFGHNLAPQGIPGEVIVAGPHVLRHYINNPLAEAETKLRIDGKVWHRTGDCGMLDDSGRLYLLGRCNEVFVWKRRQYYPAIVTYALRAMAGVRESALLLIDGHPCLVLEKSERILLPEVEASLPELGLSGSSIRFIKKIPKDPRHQTKVDYALLSRM